MRGRQSAYAKGGDPTSAYWSRRGQAALAAALWWAACLNAAAANGPGERDARRLCLAGEWRFRLDPDDVGLQQGWAQGTLPDRIRLPSSTDEQGYGTRTIGAAVGRLTRVHEYVGPAWYQRDVTVPSTWKGKRVTLSLERCHWETQVLVDGEPAGTQNSLIAPHVYDLTRLMAPGNHRLTIRVDNTVRTDIGGWGHSITDETQTNWNGIIGRMELAAVDPVWVAAARVFPDAARRSVRVELTIGNGTGGRVAGEVRVEVVPHGRRGASPVASAAARFALAGPEDALALDMGLGAAARLWDEFSPALYELRVSLEAGDEDRRYRDERAVTFGLRDLRVEGTQLALNGRPLLLRGTLECCIFPLTGYPPTDLASWLRIFRVAQSYGLNHMRFHSWCPPEAAFAAADQRGFLLQVEAPYWNSNFGDERTTNFVRAEVDRLLDTYGNHPSFGLLSMGNELLFGGGDSSFLQGVVAHCREKDPRHLYTCSTSPYDAQRNDDYFVSHFGPGGALRGQGRLNAERPSTAFDFGPALAGTERPVIAHELGQWAMYANLTEVRKYAGCLQARNFEVYRQSLAGHGMLEQAEAFRRASGALMLLLYQEEIETVLRTPRAAGFQLLDVHDFPGQGTAIVGMLDPFWDSKGLIEPQTFREYCGPTVPLLRMPKRVWTTDETLTATVDLAHYGARSLPAVTATWLLRDERGAVVAQGSLGPAAAPTGDLTALGRLSVPLGDVRAPAKLTAEVRLEEPDAVNRWNLWVYPGRLPEMRPADVHVATEWGDEACRVLAAGGKVLLLSRPDWLQHTIPGSFTPVFWCVRLFAEQPGTMGILCDPAHPALAQFPTGSHTDWQWWELLTRSRALILDETPPEYRPIIQVIDNFDRNHKLGAVFEARVGPGRLLATTIDLESDLDTRPAARQLRHSLLAYAASDRFRPRAPLPVSLLDRLFEVSAVAKMRREPAPDEVRRAVLHVKAGAHVPPFQSPAWRPEHDEVISRAPGCDYTIGGGSWLDDTGSAWHDRQLRVTITCPPGFQGTLYAHFHDWNRLGRTAAISFEGKEVGVLADHTGPGFWLALPVDATQSADGKLELSARTTSGPNVMITRVVLVPGG